MTDSKTKELRVNVATPERLPAAPAGSIHPEHIRREYANHYADLQKFKLKVMLGICAGIALHWWLS